MLQLRASETFLSSAIFYYQIIVLGKNVTAAVDYVSFQCDKDVSTIWKSYYPNVKKKIKELNSLAQF